jgi:very-short-patch-repair endonuclease
MLVLRAACGRLPNTAAFSGATAAWLHGIEAIAWTPIEITVPGDAGVSARSGLVVRRALLPSADVVRVRGLRTTTIARTLADLSARLPITEAVVVADAALHMGRISLNQLATWADCHARRRGVRNLRRVIDLAEPAAESPMESRLRMLLVLARLPRPRVQVSIYDDRGEVIGRPDLYYDRQRLGIEYDGGSHRGSLAADNRRQNRLLNAGVRLLRFTASDVMSNPAWTVAQVRTMLETHHSPANAPIRTW